MIEQIINKINKEDIDEDKLNRIKSLILAAEERNLETGELTEDEMVNLIREIIEKVVGE